MTVYLLGGSLALGLSVFLAARVLLTGAFARWGEEEKARFDRIDADKDWKRTLLAVVGRMLERVNRLQTVVKYRARLREDNIAAGVPWGLDEYKVLALSELVAVGTTIVVWIAILLLFNTFSFLTGIAIGAAAGFAPGYLLAHKAVERRIQINRALPFAMDLMVLTMEAGSSFGESVEILVESDPSTPLAQEFNHYHQAVRHGKTRQVALKEMAERIKSNDLTPVVDAINTGEEFGTPVGKTLRIQAEGIRGSRSQRAEKIAAEASSKILFPTLLIMVAVLLMLMGPVIIKAVRGELF